MSEKIIWEAKIIRHRDEQRIAVYFKQSDVLNARIKKLKDAKWSNTLKVWHLPATTDNMLRFKLIPKNDDVTEISSSTVSRVDAFIRYLTSKRYSKNTIKTYKEALLTFLKFYNQKLLNDITSDDIIIFNNDYIVKKNLSASYQNQIVKCFKVVFCSN